MGQFVQSSFSQARASVQFSVVAVVVIDSHEALLLAPPRFGNFTASSVAVFLPKQTAQEAPPNLPLFLPLLPDFQSFVLRKRPFCCRTVANEQNCLRALCVSFARSLGWLQLKPSGSSGGGVSK